MQPFKVMANRFIQLLPFLTVPGSLHRFQHELFHRYPGCGMTYSVSQAGPLLLSVAPPRKHEWLPEEDLGK